MRFSHQTLSYSNGLLCPGSPLDPAPPAALKPDYERNIKWELLQNNLALM